MKYSEREERVEPIYISEADTGKALSPYTTSPEEVVVFAKDAVEPVSDTTQDSSGLQNETTGVRRVTVTPEMFLENFDQFYLNWNPLLVNYLRRFSLTREESEDVSHDVMIKYHTSIRSYDPEKGKFTTWLLHLANNTAIDLVRKKKRVAFHSLDESKNGREYPEEYESVTFIPGAELFEATKNETLQEAMSKLGEKSPDQLEVLTLVYQGKTIAQIAEYLDIPIGTVKTRHHLGKAKLKKLLSDHKDLLFD